MKNQIQEIREILEEWAFLMEIHEDQETKDFIEAVLDFLSNGHPSYIEDCKTNLLKRKQVKALRQSIGAALIKEGLENSA